MLIDAAAMASDCLSMWEIPLSTPFLHTAETLVNRRRLHYALVDVATVVNVA